ncbi:MAG: CHAT domain-containing protein [Bacteroidota bacterium]
MPPRHRFLHTSLLLTSLLTALLSSCSDKPTPEQLRADAAFDEAQSSLERGNSRDGRLALFTALSLDEALGRRQRIADEARMLGDLSAAAGAFDSAFTWYTRAMREYREVADRASARAMTLAIAGMHRRMGEERKAFAMYTEALRLARVFHDNDGVHDILWALLPCARALDEDEEEARILRELLDDYTASADVAHQGAVLLESGIGKYRDRIFDRAGEDALRALMLAEQARDSLLAVRATLRLAMAFEGAGKTRDALASYGDCLKRADRTRGAADLRLEALIRVGNLYLGLRRFPDATRFFQAARPSARALGNSIAEGYTVLQLGHCTVETSRESAYKNYRAGLESFKTLGYPAGLAYASLCLGHLFQRNNQPNDALQYFKSAIEQSELSSTPRDADDLAVSCEQAYFGARRMPWYTDAIDILLQLGRYDEAFWYADRRNSRELFTALSQMEIQPADDSARTLMESCAASRARMIGAQRQFVELASRGGNRRDLIPDVRGARDRAATDNAAATVATAKAFRMLEPFVRVSSLGIPEIQKALPPGTALVQHVLARRALYAFVITNARSNVVLAAIDKDRVFDLAKEFDDLLRVRELYADSSRAQQNAIDQRLREVNAPLYDAFLRPIESALAGIPNVLVVVPREVPWLPIHALHPGALRGGGYFAEQHMVSYLPSAGALLLPRSSSRPVKEVVAVGYPGGSGWDVEYELRDIRAFYKDVRLYFGQQASLATLQQERGDLLHIAARFLFNDERPGNSCFILSDGKAAEIMKRIPDGELLSLPRYGTVVVSDLDSGRSGIRPAEAYLFLGSGTQELIFTARPPSRKAKKFFGEVLYTSLLAGANSRTAFQKAQTEMIKSAEYAPPHVWAPFVLWGK